MINLIVLILIYLYFVCCQNYFYNKGMYNLANVSYFNCILSCFIIIMQYIALI